ncbi:MAG: PKD domain-containing protein [Phycisphaerales bacterium]
MKTLTNTCVVASILALGAVGACEKNTRSSSGEPATSRVNLSLEPSTRSLMVGEIVTITARSEDTYGRNSQLNWSSTAGKVTTEENGRIARVKFEQPGTYTVSAVLMIDGREARREAVEIRVKPLS